ncbi:thioredoxin domain-containing protein 11-like [Thunnus thynnus]|uniref:thioredoxin domain-containing protein 11-like n=1 Tax=Thunnus thynnus TaxID=8237 RepID=UPI003528E611
MDIQRDVLLFYYTQWCGFCSVLNHIIIQLARLLQGNSTITVARVNVARNDLPWEFMVDHVPTILLFPRYRKHLSVKFPDNLPITLPNLLHFILQHCGSPHYADKPVTSSDQADGPGAELQRERHSLEEQHWEKSRQLGEAVRRLQELADTSESLLNENTLLRKDRTEAEVERKEAEQKRSLLNISKQGILRVTQEKRKERRREDQETKGRTETEEEKKLRLDLRCGETGDLK